MKMNRFPGTCLLAALLLCLSISCKKQDKDTTTEEILPSTSDAATNEMIKLARQATSKFNSTTQALNAGYLRDDHCVFAAGLGAMGYHWTNPSLVDAEFDLLKPETVLYAPGPGGQLRPVGLEYIVLNTGQPRPMFGNQPFDVGGTPLSAPHWSLHVWSYENNPSGIFMPFNPNVTCP